MTGYRSVNRTSGGTQDQPAKWNYLEQNVAAIILHVNYRFLASLHPRSGALCLILERTIAAFRLNFPSISVPSLSPVAACRCHPKCIILREFQRLTYPHKPLGYWLAPLPSKRGHSCARVKVLLRCLRKPFPT